MFNNLITASIFVMGFLTVCYSLIASYKFNLYKKKLEGKSRKLTKSISFQLIGEGILGLGTLIFALGAYMGWLPEWDTYIQSSLRFFMFFASFITTRHLINTIKKF